MKQYDKIWVPARKEDPASDCWQIGTPMPQHGPVIVLTIEELRELWDECRDETWQDARPTTKYEKPDRLPGFEGYMQSKGIKID